MSDRILRPVQGEKVVLAGGSGFVGNALQALLRELGYEVVVLSRRGPEESRWDGKSLGLWQKQLEGAAAVVNLSGETVAQKWTLKAQERILNSRLDTTRTLGAAILACERPPSVWINASAVGFYGDRGEEKLDESSPAGNPESFLVKTCLAWEAAQTEFNTPATVQSRIRIGFVCGRNGGGLPVLLGLTRMFAGGHVGTGRQVMSWIHLHDLVRLIAWAIQNRVEGVINGTAPHPVSNAEFMQILRRVVGRPWAPPAPAFALQLASAFGAPDPEIVLAGQFVSPTRALERGFVFDYPELESALRNIVA